MEEPRRLSLKHIGASLKKRTSGRNLLLLTPVAMKTWPLHRFSIAEFSLLIFPNTLQNRLYTERLNTKIFGSANFILGSFWTSRRVGMVATLLMLRQP